jgi:hypothetical protein
MISDEITQRLPQAGIDRISSTANDRPVGQKLKWPIFDDIRSK